MWGFSSGNMKRCKEIIKNVYYLPEFPNLDCNIYILKHSDGSLTMIDTGNGLSMRATLKGMEQAGLDPEKIGRVLITHEHLDHVLGLYTLTDILGDDKFKIYAHPKTAQILKEGDEDKIAPRVLGISARQFGVKIRPLRVEEVVPSGDFIIDDFSFKVYNTPGHSLGSVTYYDPGRKILFPGDVVFPQGSFGRYDFPGGSLRELQNSIEMLTKLSVSHLCSGHMPPVIGNAERSIMYSFNNINSLGRFY